MTDSNDKELEELEAERKDEEVDVEIHEDAPDPDLTPQSLIEVQDEDFTEVPDA